MDQIRGKAKSLLSILPPGQRVVAGVAVGVLALAAVAFGRWLTTPSYTLLYGNLDDTTLSTVIERLEADGVAYKIEGGGSRVLVPQSKVYEVRAALAQAGVAGRAAPPGYELLDEQGIATSEFKQRVDYRRALEGELARTLTAMDGIDTATVRLAIPERSPFDDARPQATASVLVGSTRTLSQGQIETIVFLVSNAVEGLEPPGVTVADATGRILAAPGDVGGSGASGDRALRLTREYETAIAGGVQKLLDRATAGTSASVTVHATLNFDETQIENETVDPASAVPVSEREASENLTGGDAAPAGVPGVSGGAGAAAAGDVDYRKQESERELAISRQITRTTRAPGRLEKLSIAIIMDDGSKTGATVPGEAAVRDLVAAAVGLDEERGDTINVTQVPFEKPGATAADAPAAPGGMLAMLPKVAGGVVLVLVAFTLFSMMMRGRKRARGITLDFLEASPVERVTTGERQAELVGAAPMALGAGARFGGEPSPGSAAMLGAAIGIPEQPAAGATAAGDVMDLVQRQPEEIASILRGWLADRRR